MVPHCPSVWGILTLTNGFSLTHPEMKFDSHHASSIPFEAPNKNSHLTIWKGNTPEEKYMGEKQFYLHNNRENINWHCISIP